MELCENSNVDHFIENQKKYNVPLPEDVYFILFLFFF
jgi:hypothetical protein